MHSENNVYEVAIIGGGIAGTALLYGLSNYTNINRIVLIEKKATNLTRDTLQRQGSSHC